MNRSELVERTHKAEKGNLVIENTIKTIIKKDDFGAELDRLKKDKELIIAHSQRLREDYDKIISEIEELEAVYEAPGFEDIPVK